ncbi:vWA domain-containing protein [Acanthopleuribacter pedis]|uniref:VWA domain-containing protein n=1 Tax=Acanthopleuribacter pedis TaxID=442870 RepID=A0A8J7QGS4_9BACT|nr:vWA domain-containing protein [Acanthopleuribacter pedis]MBO1318295.1 VWA domain-containing protein [Acanthopleuribacter pedis]
MIRLLFLLVTIQFACFHGHASGPAVIEIVVSPHLSGDQEDALRNALSDLLLTKLRPGDILSLVSMHTLQRRFVIKLDHRLENRTPEQRRALLYKVHVQELSKLPVILKELTSPTPGFKANLVRYLRNFTATEFGPEYDYHLVWVGSPIVTSTENTFNDMRNAYPTDGVLHEPQSIFYTGTISDRFFQNCHLYVFFKPSLEDFTSITGYRDLHQQKMQRIYALFMQAGFGSLNFFGSAIDRLNSIPTSAFPAITVPPDPSQKEGQVFQFERATIKNGILESTPKIWTAPKAKPTALDLDAPSSETTGPLTIGLRFPSGAVDLDLYTQFTGDDELSFRKEGTESSQYGGHFLKDYSRGAALATHGHETVIYDSPDADLRQLKLFINHYSGRSSEPIPAEVRIVHKGIEYTKIIPVPGGVGDHGRGDRRNSDRWRYIDPREIVGNPDALRHYVPDPLPENLEVTSVKNVAIHQGKTGTQQYQPKPGTHPPNPHTEPIIKAVPATSTSTPAQSLFQAPKTPQSEVLILVDTSGSMARPVSESIAAKYLQKQSVGEMSCFELVVSCLQRYAAQHPDAPVSTASYSTPAGCDIDPVVFPVDPTQTHDDLKRTLNTHGGDREQLTRTLQQAPSMFTSGRTAPGERLLLVLGDGADACPVPDTTLCDVVLELERQGIEVVFYSFALGHRFLEENPCVKDRLHVI